MEDVKIILSTLWVTTMLTYFLGDVLRIFPVTLGGARAQV